MKDPGYQEYDEAQVPSDTRDGVVAKIVTGQTSTGIKGPVTDVTVDPLYAELPHGAGRSV